jgi:hypothetical protein
VAWKTLRPSDGSGRMSSIGVGEQQRPPARVLGCAIVGIVPGRSMRFEANMPGNSPWAMGSLGNANPFMNEMKKGRPVP